jgi:hypothetical protein
VNNAAAADADQINPNKARRMDRSPFKMKSTFEESRKKPAAADA